MASAVDIAEDGGGPEASVASAVDIAEDGGGPDAKVASAVERDPEASDGPLKACGPEAGRADARDDVPASIRENFRRRQEAVTEHPTITIDPTSASSNGDTRRPPSDGPPKPSTDAECLALACWGLAEYMRIPMGLMR